MATAFMKFLPENISTFKIDQVLLLIFVIVGFWLVLSELFLLFFLVSSREKKDKKAAYLPAQTIKATMWVLVPALFILLCDLIIDHASAQVWHEVKQKLPEAHLEVEIRGQQFAWNMNHPGKDKKLGTEDDIQTINELFVPVNQPIQFRLSSLDVIHSFFVPHLRLKQDAVPGRVFKGWFQATKAGDYPIVCAELCGVGHGLMKATLHVLEEKAYENWLKEAR